MKTADWKLKAGARRARLGLAARFRLAAAFAASAASRHFAVKKAKKRAVEHAESSRVVTRMDGGRALAVALLYASGGVGGASNYARAPSSTFEKARQMPKKRASECSEPSERNAKRAKTKSTTISLAIINICCSHGAQIKHSKFVAYP